MASALRKSAFTAFSVIVLGAGAFFVVTKPQPAPAEEYANLGEPDLKNGETMFWAGGC